MQPSRQLAAGSVVWQRPGWKGGGGRPICHTLTGVSHDARRASVTGVGGKPGCRFYHPPPARETRAPQRGFNYPIGICGVAVPAARGGWYSATSVVAPSQLHARRVHHKGPLTINPMFVVQSSGELAHVSHPWPSPRGSPRGRVGVDRCAILRLAWISNSFNPNPGDVDCRSSAFRCGSNPSSSSPLRSSAATRSLIGC